MSRASAFPTALCLVGALSACASPGAPPPTAVRASRTPQAAPVSDAPPPRDAGVRSTILRGTGGAEPVTAAARRTPRRGSVTLNFPNLPVADFAQAVIGDILDTPFVVDPAAKGTVSLVTATPVARSEVLGLAEEALRSANFALEPSGRGYAIRPLDQIRAQGRVAGAGPGFGNETLKLKYANPVELKAIIDPILPGVVLSADAASETLSLQGTAGQRAAARDLAAQFDYDWLKGKSFGLFVPQNSDARLIAPELDKLINAPGSTTAGLVKLLAMEKLNGIIAISSRPEFLDDVRRWVEVLDREGRSTERQFYVYRAQNGRAADLAKVLISALGGAPSGGSSSSGQGQGRGRAGGGIADRSADASGLSSGDGLTPGSGGLQQGQTLPGQSPSPPSTPRSAGAADTLVITSDDVNNAVVSFATPREYALVENALRRLDIAPLQVVIEAAISEVTLNDTLQYGTQWFFQTHNNQYALSQGSSSTPVQNFPGFAYTLFNGAGGIRATLNALSEVTHVQVLSAPNLMVLNNQTASLQVGDQVPISTGSAVGTIGGNAPIVNSVDYRDTGVILKVTPRVNSSGLVLLDVSQEVSQVNTTSSAISTNPIDSPVISERKIASSIAVRDGQTVALGGLISDNDSRTRTGVPFLSAIPVLGALVGSRNTKRDRTELLVLLTPRVIRDPEQAQEITDELKARIRSIAPERPRIEP